MNDPRVLERLAQVVPVRVDVDDEAGSMLGKKFGFAGVPAIAFVTPGGELVHRVTGGVPADDFLVHLDSALAVYEEGQKSGTPDAPPETPAAGEPGG